MNITSLFLNADVHDEDTVLVTPPPILVKVNIVKLSAVWQVKKAIFGLREAPRLWQGERDQQLRDLEFQYLGHKAHLAQSHIHPSLWFSVEGPLAQSRRIPRFDQSLRSDEWTARLHDHEILGLLGVYVSSLLASDALNNALTKSVQQVWKTSTPTPRT